MALPSPDHYLSDDFIGEMISLDTQEVLAEIANHGSIHGDYTTVPRHNWVATDWRYFHGWWYC